MASSYPGAIDSFTAITTGTVLAKSHLLELAEAIEAVQGAMGTLPQQTAGSLYERVGMSLDEDGLPFGATWAPHAKDGKRRVRCGTYNFNTADGPVLSVPVFPIWRAADFPIFYWVTIQNLDGDYLNTTTAALRASATNTNNITPQVGLFQVRIHTANGNQPVSGQTCILHWLGVGAVFTADAQGLDDVE